MPTARSMRLVNSALRCYPQRWRGRHGEEAAEIATLLIQDGTPAWSIAWSYLIGAAKARLVTGPRRLGAAAGALLLATGSLGVSLALLSSSVPANAASVAHSHAASPAAGRPGTGPPTAKRPATQSPAQARARRAGARRPDVTTPDLRDASAANRSAARSAAGSPVQAGVRRAGSGRST